MINTHIFSKSVATFGRGFQFLLQREQFMKGSLDSWERVKWCMSVSRPRAISKITSILKTKPFAGVDGSG